MFRAASLGVRGAEQGRALAASLVICVRMTRHVGYSPAASDTCARYFCCYLFLDH